MDTHEIDDASQVPDSVPAPTNIEEVSDYLARISVELNERKTAAEEAVHRVADVERAAQGEIDEVTRRALREVREVQRRTDAEIGHFRARLTAEVQSVSKERDAAVARYADAIDKVVSSGLVARKLLASMGFTAPRSKSKPKPVVSKIKPKDMDD